MRKWFLLISCMLLLACQQGAQQTQFVGTDITGADFGNSLKLTDHNGKARQLSDFKGKAVALFFGYTHCPDVCPTTMADLAHAMKLMGKRSDEVQVLFVTLDPERDTQQVLAQFVPSFDSRFLGLYGTPEQIAETAKNFKIFYAKQEQAGKSGYTIDHSAGVYAFDKNGKIRVYIKFGQKPEEIAHDLGLII
jgi:protein SCO1/2